MVPVSGALKTNYSHKIKTLQELREAIGPRPRAKKDTDLCSGPARLTQALSITGANDGADLVLGDQDFRVLADDSPAPTAVVAGPRIGISRATEQPWRWYLAGNPHVSRK